MTRHRITRADGSPHFLAGLWASHIHEGETTESYTMIMQDALGGDDIRPFHDRQPVFLDARSAAVWLDPRARYHDLLVSSPKGTLAFDPPEPVGACVESFSAVDRAQESLPPSRNGRGDIHDDAIVGPLEFQEGP